MRYSEIGKFKRGLCFLYSYSDYESRTFRDYTPQNVQLKKDIAAIKLEAISLRWLFLLASLVGLLPLNEDFFGVCF